jgi:hypothetical protein
MVVVAAPAPAGTFAVANANTRSGSRVSAVPSARTANPNQIQLTRGLTVTA